MINIVNVVNFIRAVEPRAEDQTYLLETVKGQIELMKKYHIKGTFLLQYDAMIRSEYVELLGNLDPEQFELGIWFEMNQPHVEAAGLKWRGREGFAWDWHANVSFSIGYTKEEREKLVDVIFAKFEECFHKKARSIGSWMIDAHSLAYIVDHYNVVASCNCRDQLGTDGYSIWGGYWNQAYYPSRNNALCPAQTGEYQIQVPVFRMLGSDPVIQYDRRINCENDIAVPLPMGVVTLEPACAYGGGCPDWVEWFMRQNFCGGSLAFAYAQAGQENSMGWRPELEYQLALFEKWSNEGKLRLERLMDSGEWYQANFARTPATAVSALEPYGDRQAQSVWYNCVNYRMNLYREGGKLRIRDMMLFDERYEERYMTAVCKEEYLVYDNLAIMDGNRMSGRGILAGGWLVDEDGKELDTAEMTTEERGSALRAVSGKYAFDIDEEGVTLTGGAAIAFRWNEDRTAFKGVEGNCLMYEHRGTRYALKVVKGSVCAKCMTLFPEDGVLRIEPVRL